MRKEHIREQLFELDVRALQGSARKTDIVRPARNHERFCTADREYICAAWVRHEPAESIANHIGRTVGSVRQEVLKLQRRGQIGPRDANKTKLLRRLGKFGANPATTSEELKTIIAAQQNAAAEARRAEREATLRFHDEVIQEMRKKISQGVPRNVAIIEARRCLQDRGGKRGQILPRRGDTVDTIISASETRLRSAGYRGDKMSAMQDAMCRLKDGDLMDA